MDSKAQPKLKDAAAWLKTEAGFYFEVKFYREYLDMLLTIYDHWPN